jgi:alkanesulfonate monooxygenase SsuD/methylene tetrahydromethanopterin reductase-like flavin-dependent oxidoreductase (luciferase family)
MPSHPELRFGSFLFPKSTDATQLLDQAKLTEQLGYDLIAAPDHPYWPHYVDQWTLLSAVIGHTSSIHVFTDVVNLALREPPAVLAKAAWSLNAIAPGRLHLGLGTGGVWDKIEAIGGPRWPKPEARERLIEAVELTKRLWSGEPRVDFEGQYYRLSGAKGLPAPPQPIDIWIGCASRSLRRLVAENADGWIPNGDGIELENLTKAGRHLDQELERAGRDRGEVRRICNTIMKKVQPKSEGFLVGPAGQWVEELTQLALELDFDTFVFGDRDTTVPSLHLFAEEIIPAVRENVARARQSATSSASTS